MTQDGFEIYFTYGEQCALAGVAEQDKYLPCIRGQRVVLPRLPPPLTRKFWVNPPLIPRF